MAGGRRKTKHLFTNEKLHFDTCGYRRAHPPRHTWSVGLIICCLLSPSVCLSGCLSELMTLSIQQTFN